MLTLSILRNMQQSLTLPFNEIAGYLPVYFRRELHAKVLKRTRDLFGVLRTWQPQNRAESPRRQILAGIIDYCATAK
jgi:hypothetical protein